MCWEQNNRDKCEKLGNTRFFSIISGIYDMAAQFSQDLAYVERHTEYTPHLTFGTISGGDYIRFCVTTQSDHTHP